MQNPNRRPTRSINKDAGTVAAIVPTNCNAKGKVARAASTVSEAPVSAVTVITRVAPVCDRACATDRIKTVVHSRCDAGIGVAMFSPSCSYFAKCRAVPGRFDR